MLCLALPTLVSKMHCKCVLHKPEQVVKRSRSMWSVLRESWRARSLLLWLYLDRELRNRAGPAQV